MARALIAGAAATVVVGTLAAGVAFAADPSEQTPYVLDGQVTLCHATGAGHSILTVGVEGAAGHAGHADDVIPPVTVGETGLNFHDALGNPDWYPDDSVTEGSCNPAPGSGSLVPGAFKVLIYDYHPDVLLHRNNDADGQPGGPTHRNLHLKHARDAKAAGQLVNIGATGPGGALLVFRGGVPDSVIQQYAATDPYHTPLTDDPDLIESYEIKPWTVVG